MTTNSTPEKTIRSIIEHIAEGERSWIYDQLDGTSFVKDSLDAVDREVNEALADITRIIEECKPAVANDDPFTNALKPALYQAIDTYEHNLLKRIG